MQVTSARQVGNWLGAARANDGLRRTVKRLATRPLPLKRLQIRGAFANQGRWPGGGGGRAQGGAAVRAGGAASADAVGARRC